MDSTASERVTAPLLSPSLAGKRPKASHRGQRGLSPSLLESPPPSDSLQHWSGHPSPQPCPPPPLPSPNLSLSSPSSAPHPTSSSSALGPPGFSLLHLLSPIHPHFASYVSSPSREPRTKPHVGGQEGHRCRGLSTEQSLLHHR